MYVMSKKRRLLSTSSSKFEHKKITKSGVPNGDTQKGRRSLLDWDSFISLPKKNRRLALHRCSVTDAIDYKGVNEIRTISRPQNSLCNWNSMETLDCRPSEALPDNHGIHDHTTDETDGSGKENLVFEDSTKNLPSKSLYSIGTKTQTDLESGADASACLNVGRTCSKLHSYKLTGSGVFSHEMHDSITTSVSPKSGLSNLLPADECTTEMTPVLSMEEQPTRPICPLCFRCFPRRNSLNKHIPSCKRLRANDGPSKITTVVQLQQQESGLQCQHNSSLSFCEKVGSNVVNATESFVGNPILTSETSLFTSSHVEGVEISSKNTESKEVEATIIARKAPKRRHGGSDRHNNVKKPERQSKPPSQAALYSEKQHPEIVALAADFSDTGNALHCSFSQLMAFGTSDNSASLLSNLTTAAHPSLTGELSTLQPTFRSTKQINRKISSKSSLSVNSLKKFLNDKAKSGGLSADAVRVLQLIKLATYGKNSSLSRKRAANKINAARCRRLASMRILVNMKKEKLVKVPYTSPGNLNCQQKDILPTLASPSVGSASTNGTFQLRWTCEYCQAQFKIRLDLRNHQRSVCKAKKSSPSVKNAAKHHVAHLHRRVGSSSVNEARQFNSCTPITCSGCDKVFKGKTCLVRHQKLKCKSLLDRPSSEPILHKLSAIAHQEMNSASLNEPPFEEDKLGSHSRPTCSACSKTFKHRRYLMKHLRKNCKGAPSPSVIESTCLTSSAMQMESTPVDRRQVEKDQLTNCVRPACSACQRTFKHEKYLLQHLNKSCKGAPIESPTISAAHATRFDSPSIEMESSPVAGGSLKEDTLSSHIPPTCSACQRTFKHEKYLAQHLNRSCKGAPVVSPTTSTARTALLDSPSIEKESTSISSPPPGDNNDARLTCSACQKTFKCLKYLRTHLFNRCKGEALVSPTVPSAYAVHSDSSAVETITKSKPMEPPVIDQDPVHQEQIPTAEVSSKPFTKVSQSCTGLHLPIDSLVGQQSSPDISDSIPIGFPAKDRQLLCTHCQHEFCSSFSLTRHRKRFGLEVGTSSVNSETLVAGPEETHQFDGNQPVADYSEPFTDIIANTYESANSDGYAPASPGSHIIEQPISYFSDSTLVVACETSNDQILPTATVAQTSPSNDMQTGPVVLQGDGHETDDFSPKTETVVNDCNTREDPVDCLTAAHEHSVSSAREQFSNDSFKVTPRTHDIEDVHQTPPIVSQHAVSITKAATSGIADGSSTSPRMKEDMVIAAHPDEKVDANGESSLVSEEELHDIKAHSGALPNNHPLSNGSTHTPPHCPVDTCHAELSGDPDAEVSLNCLTSASTPSAVMKPPVLVSPPTVILDDESDGGIVTTRLPSSKQGQSSPEIEIDNQLDRKRWSKIKFCGHSRRSLSLRQVSESPKYEYSCNLDEHLPVLRLRRKVVVKRLPVSDHRQRHKRLKTFINIKKTTVHSVTTSTSLHVATVSNRSSKLSHSGDGDLEDNQSTASGATTVTNLSSGTIPATYPATERPTSRTSRVTYSCPGCRKGGFQNHKALTCHRIGRPPGSVCRLPPVPEKSDTTFPCPFCGRQHKNLIGLRVHRAACARRHRGTQRLRTPSASDVANSNSFICPGCSSKRAISFSSVDAVLTHLIRLKASNHPSIGRPSGWPSYLSVPNMGFGCHICGMLLASESRLDKHKRAQHEVWLRREAQDAISPKSFSHDPPQTKNE